MACRPSDSDDPVWYLTMALACFDVGRFLLGEPWRSREPKNVLQDWFRSLGEAMTDHIDYTNAQARDCLDAAAVVAGLRSLSAKRRVAIAESLKRLGESFMARVSEDQRQAALLASERLAAITREHRPNGVAARKMGSLSR